MEAQNNQIRVAVYEDESFWDDCEKFFSQGDEFVVICGEKSVAKCRNAIKLFLELEHEQPKGLARLILLAKVWVAGISVALLLAVCNRAILLGWIIISDDLYGNQILHLKRAK
jgi:hypothetical protein